MKIRYTALVFLVAFVITSCAPFATSIPTSPIWPTATSVPSPVPFPTQTSTPQPLPTLPSTAAHPSLADLEIKYRSNLPPAPAGFAWKVIPEYFVAVLVPNGWFFRQHDVFDMHVAGEFAVSKENFDENGKYSTGMTIVAYVSDDPETFAEGFLTDFVNAATTTQIIASWDSKINGRDAHNLKITAVFPGESEANKNKTLQYSIITAKSWAYLVVFESPASSWEQVAGDYTTMLANVTIFDE
jgi:hypothetical protein